MNIRIWVLVLISAPLVAGCAAVRVRGTVPDISEQQLLSGEIIFGEHVDTADIPDPGLFELDDDMRAFVAEHVGRGSADRGRMRSLLSGMIKTGLMSLDYNDTKTKTARQTFHDRVGNCMSFTALFVALAREANLDVAFQTVDIPPIWYADSDLVIVNNHVNAVVKANFESRTIVDFNVTELKGDYNTTEVSDDYAHSLYFNNVAMDALRAKEHFKSFKLLKKSFEIYPSIADSWANLGVIYSRNKQYDYAIKAYSVALELEKNHRPALTNLAALYRNVGEPKLANYYSRKINRYQNRNPYYHYYHALNAYNKDDFDEASKHLKRAFRIFSEEHKFYQLQGLIYERLGDTEMAVYSYGRARDLAAFGDAISVYDRKIAFLTEQ